MSTAKPTSSLTSLGGSWRAYALADPRGPLGPWWWRISATGLSILYALAVSLRSGLYRSGLLSSRTLPGKTISIGNLAAGGTGKSPITLRLAQLLQDAGATPAILTRGYGSGLAPSDSLALLAGQVLMAPTRACRPADEAMMQSMALPAVPVVVGRNRFAAAQRFLREHPQRAPSHWLLDDGMQHWQLTRDFELVLLDARVPLPRLMPRGVGRERPSALKRADLVILTRCAEGVPAPAQISSVHAWTSAPVVQTSMRTGLPEQSSDGLHRYDPLKHATVCLVSAVARPDDLREAVVNQLGLIVNAEIRLPDHGLIDRQRLQDTAAASDAVLTTAKDYWRDPAVFAGLPQPVFILPLTVTSADTALDLVIKRLR